MEKKARENIKKEEDRNKPKYVKKETIIKDSVGGLKEGKPKQSKKEQDSDDEYDFLLEEEDEELRALKERRLALLKQAGSKKMELINTRSHTKYTDIEEDQFLDTVLKSKYCVCHFYHRDFERCKIVDKHLSLLCQKYWQTRFVKINAEKAPFFSAKLQIRSKLVIFRMF